MFGFHLAVFLPDREMASQVEQRDLADATANAL